MNQKQRRQSRATGSAGEKTAQSIQTNDGYANFGARLGWGSDNLASQGQYALSYQGRNRVWLEAAYRGSWIVGNAVNAAAEDMTRAGLDFSGIEPEAIESIEREFHRLALWERLCDTIKWARLYGGSVAYMLIEGQDPSTPLRIDTVAKGQFKGLMVLDRWMVNPSVNEPVTEFGPMLGKPKFYDILPAAMGLGVSGRVHHTRMLRFEGCDLPYYQRLAENGWGLSILEPMWDRLVAFDSATIGAAQLVYKCHLRTMKVDKLREIIAVGGKALQGLQAQMDFIRSGQSNEGLTVIDASDDFDVQQYTFSGLSDMIQQFAHQLSGATGIPMTRLFGQSANGLGATGEGDRDQYHERIAQDQEARLRGPLFMLLHVMGMSLFGQALPESFGFRFNPLEQMNDKEKAEIAVQVTTAVTGAVDSGLCPPHVGMKELKASSQVTGIFGNISQEDIDQAEAAPPPMADMEPMGGQDQPGQEPAGGLMSKVMAKLGMGGA